MNEIIFLLALAPLPLVVGGLAIAGASRRAREAEVPIARAGHAGAVGLGQGQMAILAAGSYGARLLPEILKACLRAGTDSVVGAILLIEPDEFVRDQCLAALPKPFRNRLTVAGLANFPVGMSGASISDVQQVRESWSRHAGEATFRWLDAIKASTENGVLVALISPGGSAALGADAIQAYRREWPWKKAYGATILDEKTSVRERFGDLVSLYEPLVDGMIVSDNRRGSDAADVALCLLLGATPAARLISDRPVDLWNALASVFTNFRFATLSSWGTALPVTWRGSHLSPNPVTRRTLVEEAAKAGVHAVCANRTLQSTPLTTAPLGNTRLALAAMPIVARQLRRCVRAAREDLEPWRAEEDPNLLVEFAPIRAPLLSGMQSIPVYVLLLQPLDVTSAQLAAFARAETVDPSFKPPPPPGLRPRDLLPSANGTAPNETRMEPGRSVS